MSAEKPKSDHHAAIRNALARLYSGSRSARVLALDAGLDTGRIYLSGSPQEFWQAIVEEAEKSKRLYHLIQCALKDYPADAVLMEARRHEIQWAFKPSPSEPASAETQPGLLRQVLQHATDEPEGADAQHKRHGF